MSHSMLYIEICTTIDPTSSILLYSKVSTAEEALFPLTINKKVDPMMTHEPETVRVSIADSDVHSSP